VGRNKPAPVELLNYKLEIPKNTDAGDQSGKGSLGRRKENQLNLLSLENINLEFQSEEKKIPILHDINLNFEAGKMYAITGPNGSGKSSVVRVAMGIYRHTSGRVLYNGEDISELGISERARKGIGYAFQHPPRFKGMPVKDMLEMAMKYSDSVNCQVLRDIGLCPDEYLERTLDNSLSGGEIKRIEIATLLAQNPKMRIFDEPEAGIDLWSFEQLINVIGGTHREDTSTVVISHQEKILNMVDEIILIEDGTVSMRGSRDEIWPRIKASAECSCRYNCQQEGEIYADCPR